MQLLFKSNFKLIIHMNGIDPSVYWVDSGTKTAAEGPEVVFASLLNSYVDRSPWVVEKTCHVSKCSRSVETYWDISKFKSFFDIENPAKGT